MLSVSGRGGRARLPGAVLVAAGAAALFLSYWVLRDGPTKPSSAVRGTAPSAATEAARQADDVERPATARPRPKRAGGPQASSESAADSAPAPPVPTAEAAGSAVQAVLSAAADPSRRGTETLIDSLTSEDEIVVAEATRALIARRATEAIRPLARIDLRAAAGSGLSIIDALGKLAGAAEGAERSVAVDRLIAMLAEEKRRGARESPGNLIQIYEALGQTGDPRAAPPLEAELLDPTVPRAPKVVIVASLVLLGQDSSRAAFETALATERAAKGSDDFEEEIRLELVSALEGALGLK